MIENWRKRKKVPSFWLDGWSDETGKTIGYRVESDDDAYPWVGPVFALSDHGYDQCQKFVTDLTEGRINYRRC